MSEDSRKEGPLMQSGGIRENFPEQVILSFLLKRGRSRTDQPEKMEHAVA